MNIIVNGSLKNITGEITLEKLIRQFSLDPNRVIAELNDSIIKRNTWGQQILKDGDRLELITLVGGG